MTVTEAIKIDKALDTAMRWAEALLVPMSPLAFRDQLCALFGTEHYIARQSSSLSARGQSRFINTARALWTTYKKNEAADSYSATGSLELYGVLEVTGIIGCVAPVSVAWTSEFAHSCLF